MILVLSAPFTEKTSKVPTTMSSREIAELTGKRHDNVTRDIRNMLEELGEDVLSFEGMSQDAYSRANQNAHLGPDSWAF